MQRIFVGGLVVILCGGMFYRIFFNLLQAPVERWDEQTNIEVVINSLSHKSFPVLYIDDKPFFEKPPLWYWITAIVVKSVNQSPFSMRLLSAVSGVGVILLTVFLAWRWWGVYAGISSWIVLLTTNQLFVTNAGGYFSSHTFRSADVDALQILLMIIAFAACTRITANKLMPVIAGVATGLALLTKGPLGIIPLVTATVLSVHIGKAVKQSIFTAWKIFFFTAVPWYLFMTIRFGFPFLSMHFGYHIIERTLSPIEGHDGSVWYYFQLLANRDVFFFWTLVVFSFVWVIVKKLYRKQNVLYVFVSTIIFFIIPTFIRTRLAWYILPFYPFAALVVGIAMADVAKGIMKHL